ncbi:hypothetical protein LEMLEM_LOCUS7006 [Lemmus lemmus]
MEGGISRRQRKDPRFTGLWQVKGALCLGFRGRWVDSSRRSGLLLQASPGFFTAGGGQGASGGPGETIQIRQPGAPAITKPSPQPQLFCGDPSADVRVMGKHGESRSTLREANRNPVNVQTLPQMPLNPRVASNWEYFLPRSWDSSDRPGKIIEYRNKLDSGSQHPTTDARNISVGVREPQALRAGAEREELSHQLWRYRLDHESEGGGRSRHLLRVGVM